MTLALPEYIRRSGIQDDSVRFSWEDWNEQAAYEPPDEEVRGRLAGLSFRASVALTAACAEWIVYRFGPLSRDALPLNYAEAAWAGLVDWRYAQYYEISPKDWQGPVRGPLGTTIVLLVGVLGRVSQWDDPEISAASMTKLARHVMANHEPFDRWSDWALKRLEALFARDPDEPMGSVVPRETLDPDFAFRVEQTDELINRFLAGLDPISNQFLNTPGKMLDEGFVGTPYVFDADRDREIRFG